MVILHLRYKKTLDDIRKKKFTSALPVLKNECIYLLVENCVICYSN